MTGNNQQLHLVILYHTASNFQTDKLSKVGFQRFHYYSVISKLIMIIEIFIASYVAIWYISDGGSNHRCKLYNQSILTAFIVNLDDNLQRY